MQLVSKKQKLKELIQEVTFKLKRKHHFQEMAKVGSFNNFIVAVYEGEGPIPHFHFTDATSKRAGCLKILTNEYFAHGKYKATLNAKERKDLVAFLQKERKSKRFTKGTTNFDLICELWNMNNEQYELPEDVEMPDYRNIM